MRCMKFVDEKQLEYSLALCGLSQSMMCGLFLDSTAPLYGCADEIMRLAPIRLPYGWCAALLGIEGRQKFA